MLLRKRTGVTLNPQALDGIDHFCINCKSSPLDVKGAARLHIKRKTQPLDFLKVKVKRSEEWTPLGNQR